MDYAVAPEERVMSSVLQCLGEPGTMNSKVCS